MHLFGLGANLVANLGETLWLPKFTKLKLAKPLYYSAAGCCQAPGLGMTKSERQHGYDVNLFGGVHASGPGTENVALNETNAFNLPGI